jgi:glycosyltransferase involved in cell wall biosynthesis
VKVALLGTRGIPASYGGFETFAEELSTRLVQRGHDVTVYCRERCSESLYRGVHLQYLPTLRHKYFDTLAHTFLSTMHLLGHRQDVALYCNAANAVFTGLPRVFGMPVALNVDGIERLRKKWNALARAWYLLSERLATWLPNEIVTDAENIRGYYRQRYRRDSVFIPYGAPTGNVAPGAALARLGLDPNRYFLYVTRFEPENNPLEVRQAFEATPTDLKLAIVGDAPYAAEYVRQVRDTSDPRIVLPGAIYGDGYHELQSNSFAYIHATEVGGTHPALIEAMGRRALVLYLNTPENHEVAGGAGLAFEKDELPALLRRVLEMPVDQRESLRDAALRRVEERYSWDAVTAAYEKLLLDLAVRSR